MRPLAALAGAAREAPALLWETARGALALWKWALWIPLLAVVPEFLQHVAEIRLGMFDSRAAFAAMAMAPERWNWGYLKIAGLVCATLVTVWYWLRRDGTRPLWPRVGAALALNVAVSLVPLAFPRLIGEPGAGTASMVLQVITLPLLPYLVGAIAGDPAMTLRRSYVTGWWIALRMLLLMALGAAALQVLHGLNHKLAMGQPDGLVWALMVWDSLVVGMLAVWVGTALHRGYRGRSVDSAR